MVEKVSNHQNIQAMTQALSTAFSQIYSETLEPKERKWTGFCWERMQTNSWAIAYQRDLY